MKLYTGAIFYASRATPVHMLTATSLQSNKEFIFRTSFQLQFKHVLNAQNCLLSILKWTSANCRMFCAHLRRKFYTRKKKWQREVLICSSHTKLTTLTDFTCKVHNYSFTFLLLLVLKESFGKDIFSTNKYTSVKVFGLQVDLLWKHQKWALAQDPDV